MIPDEQVVASTALAGLTAMMFSFVSYAVITTLALVTKPRLATTIVSLVASPLIVFLPESASIRISAAVFSSGLLMFAEIRLRNVKSNSNVLLLLAMAFLLAFSLYISALAGISIASI